MRFERVSGCYVYIHSSVDYLYLCSETIVILVRGELERTVSGSSTKISYYLDVVNK